MGERKFTQYPTEGKTEFNGITLTAERYTELLNAERDAKMLKNLIAERAGEPYGSISSMEIEILVLLLGITPNKPEEESEGAENG